ncbi:MULTISPECIES: HD-GYP domain-containing protein [unclassified Oceanispirochaeta]|uniref:HD-GYP domain-containing protein n=1 Tax=unclassified Oceanispirochaeta TaxID=2635722 RepID=UPI000E08E284|nr:MULTISPECIES: HD-GYP domain-containing protein [unclassified Oceanispirochaeta]MBF9014758.1 HD-GYP domain-containing protein [Oceanispirochaeta sp. M2]NPD71014.1 HD-GYP domain-containing protein [Oceanispirochaeta sp. M1]RDG33847.1 HD-GYP domain-containing protein [Oceanispirochaeta sp. M1]
MNNIESKSLKQGMYFESTVYLDNDFVLLTPETPVTEILIKNLAKWGFSILQTDGSPIGRETPSQGPSNNVQTATLDQNIKEKEGLTRARKFFSEMLEFTTKVMTRFKDDSILNLNVLTEEVKKAIAMIREDDKYVLRFQEIVPPEGSEYMYNHAVKSTILALSIGDKLKMPNHKLIELGIASLIHEIGMLQIPSKIYEKEGALTEAEKKVINAHTLLGFRSLRDFSLPRDILLGVLEHHERNDGSGYPQGLSSARISQFGKIIAVACSYDAQISNRPFRSGRDAHTSLTGMLREMRSHYDEDVMKALLTLLSIYPLGSYVTLANGYTGIVTETNAADFRHPTVKILLDKNRNALQDQPVVQTSESGEMRIVSVLNNTEISGIKALLHNQS